MRHKEVRIWLGLVLLGGLVGSSVPVAGQMPPDSLFYSHPSASFSPMPAVPPNPHLWTSTLSTPYPSGNPNTSWQTAVQPPVMLASSQPGSFQYPDPGYVSPQEYVPRPTSASPSPIADSPQTSQNWPHVLPVGAPATTYVAGNSSTPASDSDGSASSEITLEQVREEARKWAWTKGDFKIVPYGILWFNMAYETQRTVDGDYALYVYSPDVRDYDAFHVNARATRLGLDVSGPKIPFFCDASSGGKVEIDFFSPVQVPENRAGVMLRHAYWEVKNEYFRLLAGQTWDLNAPLLPGTLMYSVAWGVGNLGYRRAQLRYERYIPVSNVVQFALQGALAVDLADNTPGLNGDHEGWPVIQMRSAVTLGERGPGKRPITLGFSGHIGEQFYERDPAVDTDDGKEKTWSFCVDLHMPLTERMGVQGEFFTGANLGHFMGGIVQGINPTTGRAIRSTGGWIELWYDWTKRWHSHVGYGIDDPINRDVPTGGRLYNDFIFANIMYDLTERFVMGFEYTHWKTHYQGRSPGDSDRLEFAAKYSF